jgi:hypothetical protein
MMFGVLFYDVWCTFNGIMRLDESFRTMLSALEEVFELKFEIWLCFKI